MERDKFYILVSCFEESAVSVLRLNDALQDTSLDLENWDTKRTVEIMWNGRPFPAKIIQFGEDKNRMLKMIVALSTGKVKLENISLIQEPAKNEKRIAAEGPIEMAEEIMSSDVTERIEAAQENCRIAAEGSIEMAEEIMSSDVTERIDAAQENCRIAAEGPIEMAEEIMSSDVTERIDGAQENCRKCRVSEEKLAFAERFVGKLQLELQKTQEETRASTLHLENKYREMKRKYKAMKKEVKTKESIKYPMYKYVLDLLQVHFERDILSQSVLKGGIKNSSKNILDSSDIDDIVSQVAQKYRVSVGSVRPAIRLILNTCRKRLKKVV